MESRSEAFAALYQRHHLTLVRFVFLRVSDRALAEDLAAETFAVAWQKCQEGQTITRSWLFTAARNLVGNEYQRRAHERGRLEKVALIDLVKPETWDAHIESVDMQIAMARLRPIEALVLQLVYWDGLTAAEAAQFLGCSTGALWVRLSRARAALRALLDVPETVPAWKRGEVSG